MIAATFGYAHYNAQGKLVLGWINEMVEEEACNSCRRDALAVAKAHREMR